MSLKWEKTKAWDRQNLVGGLAPVRIVLRLLSSVWLAVAILLLIALYGTIASVPVGMLALVPTYFIYGLTAIATVFVLAAVPSWLVNRALARSNPQAKASRFVIVFFVTTVFAAGSLYLWYQFAWPRLMWDPARQTGLRLFVDFVEANELITMRRLPALEMSEIEFYAWWPLKVLLGLFVVNLTVATVRRIEFDFKHIGVLTVHSGIILIALGSFMYGSGKIEGDTLLMAGPLASDGNPEPGDLQDSFYDYQKSALYVAQNGYWEQRPIDGLPRYNDYNIGLVGPPGAQAIREAAAQTPPYSLSVNASANGIGAGVLNIDLLPPQRADAASMPPGKLIDSDLRFRIVGYAAYAAPTDDFIEKKVDQSKVSPLPDSLQPLRVAYLLGQVRNADGGVTNERVFSFVMLPHDPSQRIRDSLDLGIEYTRGVVRPSTKARLESGMSAQRWADLSQVLPPKTRHALIVETAATGVAQPARAVMAVSPGTKFKVGDSGYEIEVKDLADQPPFPIITEGYKGATSSIAIVRVTQPDGRGFERYVYHRFPEINQDMLDELSDQGRPLRRDADPAIRISYIDASKLQIYVDEVAGAGADATRVLIRQPAGDVRIINDVGSTNIVSDIFSDPAIGLEIGTRWADSRKVQRPLVVADADRERDRIGTHQNAMIGVEVSSGDPARPDSARFRDVVWVSFSPFVREMPQSKAIVLEDGREIELVFGRRRYGLPGFELQLLDFHMIPNENRGPPKDYQSLIRVVPSWRASKKIEPFTAMASLNEPLRAPFHWDDKKPYLSNAAAKMLAGLDPAQLKFSQAGWDAAGWERTQKETDTGVMPRPYVKFTRLQVGNNPGIHIIALGGILMGIGIPWAFYLKPWLVQREKRKIQQQLKDGTYIKPARPSATVQGSAS